jgi:hypothetical protein
MRKFRVGDEIVYRPSWGSGVETVVRIESMEVTRYPREKYGHPADEVDVGLVEENRVVMTLDNGHWAYSDQVDLEASREVSCGGI